MKNKPFLIIGGGGHAAALAEILIKQKKRIIGVVSPELTAGNILFENIELFLNDEDILKFRPEDILLVNGIGSMPYKSLREDVYNRFKKLGYEFATVIADSALVSDYSTLKCGVQVMNNCVVNIGSKVGENTIINTSTSIDHDCIIGAHCHLAPGTTLSGQVVIENNVHVATGVNVINNITIGHNTIIGVGANIIKAIPANSIVYGAREIIKGLDANDC
ncbi:pilus assembly protein [Pseudoalteromonas sp. S201]|uniref:NeuD/PglB/VioB family sugar acetyltransferase n=1 Tax=Pseudoalteromonas sp. S201 TaxID=579519 RepID=UPI00110CDA80|nr:NeuD/PglB/VioB family sugar acetyltransferase [Pseudoalteromonas sp. S201]TMS92573.1 pilus assembly protein [Pseudoalteromonas sp. S201]